VLQAFRNDRDRVVADSCEVALDMIDYWSNFRPAQAAPVSIQDQVH
jgi:hypothetical protein